MGAVAQSLSVNIDQATRITLSRPAHDVIMGNPMTADVTILDSRHIVLTGKSYGVTNLLINDDAGRPIMNRQVVVSAPDVNRISLYRGPDVYNFACSPRCERTPMPGERVSGSGVYDQWAPPYLGYTDRQKTGAQGASQTGAAP
jgi:hypothetical protein